MADNHMRTAGIAQHERRDLTRESAFILLGRAILSGNLDIRSLQTISDALQGRENWGDNCFAMVRISDERLEGHGRNDRVPDCLVHFPVSGNDRFAHRFDSILGDRIAIECTQ